jgi:NAD(P)-dependent dehydrogenase (short-subunit alcohol dehydrogenase family)
MSELAARRTPVPRERETVVVTGANGALGQVVLARLQGAGHQPLALVRREADAERWRADGVWAKAVDLLDEAAVAAAVSAAEADGLLPSAALLLAGGFAATPADATDLATLRRQWDLNVGTAATVVRALLPGLRRRGRGTIVGVAAGQARRGGARAGAYASSKAALAAYLRALDEEVAPEGVIAVTVFPMGTIDSPANRAAMADRDPAGWIDAGTLADVLLHVITLGPRARLREVEVYPHPR